MKRYEVVNDQYSDRPVAVVYCPIADWACAFERDFDGRPHRFASSGWVYEDLFVLYDKETESLWYPLHRDQGLVAIGGPYAGTQIPRLKSVVVPWERLEDMVGDTVQMLEEPATEMAQNHDSQNCGY